MLKNQNKCYTYCIDKRQLVLWLYNSPYYNCLVCCILDCKKNWFVLRWKKTYSILHVLFSNSSLFENEVFGEGDFIKNVCVRITLLVFPLFHTFFPYKFLNVFLRRVAWMPITKQSLSIQAKGVWSGTSPISRQL